MFAVICDIIPAILDPAVYGIPVEYCGPNDEREEVDGTDSDADRIQSSEIILRCHDPFALAAIATLSDRFLVRIDILKSPARNARCWGSLSRCRCSSSRRRRSSGERWRYWSNEGEITLGRTSKVGRRFCVSEEGMRKT